jgi:hypothetical protein
MAGQRFDGLGGQISVSIPTSELDTAQLTAQALDVNGDTSGSPLTIVPNTDVQAFLGGGSSLTSVGGAALTGSALMAAHNSTWDTTSQSYTTTGPLMPTLVKAGTTASNQVATAINHVMALPTTNPNTSGGAQSALLDFTGSAPAFQTSTDPTAYDSHKSGDTSWWEKAEHDIKSVFHGLRHAAITVSKMITTWETEAAQWTINLIVDIGDGIDRLLNWVVTGVEDAIHAVSSFFHSLGTDIEHIWNWLKNLVLGALRDTGANAKYMEAWVQTLVDGLIDEINDAENAVDGFFSGLEEDVNNKLTTLQDQVEDELFGTHTEQPTAPSGTGGDDSSSHFGGAQDVFHFLSHSPASWLINKIMSDIQPIAGNALPLSDFGPALTDVANSVDEAIDTVVDVAKEILNLFEDVASSPTSFNAASMTNLFTGFENVADDILKLLDDLANTLLDLFKGFIESVYDVITSEFQPPFIGEILRLAGVDNTPSMLHMASLTVAFPATLLHDLFAAALGGTGQPMFPFDAPTSNAPTGELGSAQRGSSAAVGNQNSDWAGFGLGVASAVTQFCWATIDVALEMGTYEAGELRPDTLRIVDFLTILDVLCPMLLTIFQWPVPPTYTGTQTPAPFQFDDFTDGTVWGNEYKFLPYMSVTGGVPWLTELIGWFLSKLPSETFPGSEADNFNNECVPLFQSLFSAANVILSAWYAYANASNDGQKAEAVIGPVISNLSYLDSIIASTQAVDATSKGIVWVKFYLDIFGNYGTVAIDVGEAIAAATK